MMSLGSSKSPQFCWRSLRSRGLRQILDLPCPTPSFTRGMDGRIDDPKAGWKGRGVWTNYASYFPKFTETKLGSVEHFQVRPNPLASWRGRASGGLAKKTSARHLH